MATGGWMFSGRIGEPPPPPPPPLGRGQNPASTAARSPEGWSVPHPAILTTRATWTGHNPAAAAARPPEGWSTPHPAIATTRANERGHTPAAATARPPEGWSTPHPVIATTRSVGVNTAITAVREDVALPRLGGSSSENGSSSLLTPSQHQRSSDSSRKNDFDQGAKIDLSPGDRNEFSEDVLARVLTVGYEFELLADGRSTWTNAMRMVAAALRRAGHNIPFTLENKKQRKDGDRNWHYGSLVCPCSGKPRFRPRHENPEKRRKTRSAKCGCTFGVSITWPRRKNPYVTQVNLTHARECSVNAKLKRLRARISRDTRKIGQAGLKMFPGQARAGDSCIGSDGDDESLVDVGHD